jgi:hypothetical protein
MEANLLWDAFRGLGALAGLFATGHIFWKWVTSGYPSVIIDARPLIYGSKQIEPILKVINHSDRPILLCWNDGRLDQFRVMKDDSVVGVVRTLFPGKTTIALAPNGVRELKLLRPQGYDDIAAENSIETVLMWKFAQPVVWQRYRKLRISIAKQDLEHLLDGYSGSVD